MARRRGPALPALLAALPAPAPDAPDVPPPGADDAGRHAWATLTYPRRLARPRGYTEPL